jgi:hypothetical protein
MAEENLPFFKFEPVWWLTGKITARSLKAQGLFINLCAWYWKNGCTLTLADAIERYPDLDNLFKELEDEEIIVTTSKFVRIKFLDRQYRKIRNDLPSDQRKMRRTKVPMKGGKTPPYIRHKNKEIKNSKNFTKRRNIIPPKIEWVREYCEKRKEEGKPPIDPDQWYNNYKAKGWLISGGTKMKDWQASIRYWEGNQKQRPVRPQNTVGSRRGQGPKKQYRKPDMEL